MMDDLDQQKQALAAMQLMNEMSEKDPAKFEMMMEALEKDAESMQNADQVPSSKARVLRDAAISQLRLQMGKEQKESLELPRGKGSLGPEGLKARDKGVELVPTPGFVVKTITMSGIAKKEEDETKVFINVCQSPLIREPAPQTRLDDEGKEVEGMNVPVSVGPPRVSPDRGGKDALVYDVVVNPKVIEEAAEDKTGAYRDFLCQLCMTYVEQKYKCALSKKYKLPKLKYQGEIATQLVKDTKKPGIQEVSSSGGAASSSSSKSTNKKATTTAPIIRAIEALKTLSQIRVGVVEVDGSVSWSEASEIEEPVIRQEIETLPAEIRIVIENVDLPPTTVIEEKEYEGIDLAPYLLCLSLKGYHKREVLLPFAVLPQQAEALIYANNREVHIRVPVDHQAWDVEPDPGSKPWLLAQALRDKEDRVRQQVQQQQRDAVQQDQDQQQNDAADTLPEDRFHLKLPAGVDPYTGIRYEGDGSTSSSIPTTDVLDEATELPEDRFHKSDFMSQHIIAEREKGKAEKADRWRQERESKMIQDDPDIEYIDVEDFKPGGKYGPAEQHAVVSKREAGADKVEEGRDEEGRSNQKKTVQLVQSALGVGGRGGGKEAGDKEKVLLPTPQNTLWAELL